MRKIGIVDLAGAFALVSVSGLFLVWALKIIVRTAGKDWSWGAAESIGTWVAGLGTLAAVVVSLVLARSSDRKEQAKDYLRARMTALRYIPPLIKVHSDLIFLKQWGENRSSWPTDGAADTATLQRLKALKLDVALDDLVLLAPIEQNFAERLHGLSMQLEICVGAATPVASALTLTYGPQSDKPPEVLQRYRMSLELALAELARHSGNALMVLNPLLDTCAKFAYTQKPTNSG